MHVRRADQQHHQQRLLGRKTKFNGVGKQPPRVERPTTARSTNHRQSAHLGKICILQSESPRAALLAATQLTTSPLQTNACSLHSRSSVFGLAFNTKCIRNLTQKWPTE
jgi:hypothetical protein